MYYKINLFLMNLSLMVQIMVIQVEQNGYTSGEEDEQFMDALEKSMEIFVNRMKSDSLRGRSIGGDSSVQTLFMTLSAMHTELVKNMQKLDVQTSKFT